MMVMANVMSNNTNSDGVHEAHLHIANKNLSYDSNRPDFGHDHNFVTADLHIYSHWRKGHRHEGGCTKNEVNVGSCIQGGIDGHGRSDSHHKLLCSRCRKISSNYI